MVTGEQWLPVFGYMGQRSRWAESFGVDWVRSTATPLSPDAHPYPYEFIAPPQNDTERQALVGEGNFFGETWLQVWNSRFDQEGRLSRTKEGHPFVTGYYEQLADEDGDWPYRFPFTDGQRNQASLNKRTSFRPDPNGPGFIGISYEGRLFRLHPTDGVTTLAGHVTRSDVVPFSPWDVPPWQGVGVTIEEFESQQWLVVGSFDNDVRFANPNDLAIDPNNPNIIYIADTGNHAIRKVDLSGAEAQVTTLAGALGVSGSADGTGGAARFNSPWSVEIVDGILYVADRGNNALRAVDLATGAVTTVMDSSQLTTPMWIRQFSNGDLAVMDNGEYNKSGGIIKRIDPVAATVVGNIIDSVRCYSFDVDSQGLVGPVDDIIAAGNYVGYDDHAVSRITPEGVASIIVKDWGLVMAAVGVGDRLQKRSQTIQKIFASFDVGQGQHDQRLIGGWHLLDTRSITNQSVWETDYSRAKAVSENSSTIRFNPDGTWQRENRSHTLVGAGGVWLEDKSSSSERGTWNADGNVLFMLWENGSFANYQYRCEGRQLKMAYEKTLEVWSRQ